MQSGMYARRNRCKESEKTILQILQLLDDKSRRCTTTIANGSSTVLAGLQCVDEGYDDTRAGVSNGVAKSDCTTIDVDLLGRDLADLLCNADDDREGFVEFEEGNIVVRDAGLLQSLGESDSGSLREVNGVNTCVSPCYRKMMRARKDGEVLSGLTDNLGQRSQVELLCLLGRHEDECRGTVAQRRGVGGSDDPALLESRSQ